MLTALPPCLGQAGDSTTTGAPTSTGEGWIVEGNIRKSLNLNLNLNRINSRLRIISKIQTKKV